MRAILFYTVQVLITSGILYGYYHFFLRNKKFHGYNRFFLLAVLVISAGIPFLKIPVYFTGRATTPSFLLQTLSVISSGKTEVFPEPGPATAPLQNQWSAGTVIFTVYALFATLAFIRFMAGIFKINRLVNKYSAERIEDIYFINTGEPGTPFSFFSRLFWNNKISPGSADGQQMFRHELFHIRHKHSYDIIFIEILSVLFWFNPFFHLIRKELKTIHEFLADQSAINKNEEWNYAELLLMQVLGSPHHRLTTAFFHNQIKRRIAMITTSQKTNYQYLRKLLVLPVAAVLVASFAFNYRVKNDALPLPGKTVTVIIDAGHGDQSGSRAADGTSEADLALTLALKIKELNKNDRIRILLTRNSGEDIDLKKRSGFANAQKPDLFISLHLNNDPEAASAPERNKSGFDVFISRKNTAFYAENRMLGAILLNYFSSVYPVENKIRQREEGIWVLDNSQCPSALVECGYLSNKKDLDFISNKSNQEKIARAILNAISQYTLQKQLPDFNERKKQIADTILPDTKIIRSTIQ